MEFGTSAATAEDLLMEHDEFETGAQVPLVTSLQSHVISHDHSSYFSA